MFGWLNPFMSETRLARQEASSASCGCEAAATCHDSCEVVSDKRGERHHFEPEWPGLRAMGLWYGLLCPFLIP